MNGGRYPNILQHKTKVRAEQKYRQQLHCRRSPKTSCITKSQIKHDSWDIILNGTYVYNINSSHLTECRLQEYSLWLQLHHTQLNQASSLLLQSQTILLQNSQEYWVCLLPSSSIDERTDIITTSDLLCKLKHSSDSLIKSEVTEELRDGALPEDFRDLKARLYLWIVKIVKRKEFWDRSFYIRWNDEKTQTWVYEQNHIEKEA